MKVVKLSRLQKTVLVLVLLILGALIGFRFHERLQLRLDPEPARTQAPPAVEVIRAQPEIFVESRAFQGEVLADDHAVISARITGKVIKVYPRQGESVSQGDLLVKIDHEEQLRELDRIRAAGDRIKGDLDLADKQLARQKELFAGEIIPRDSLDVAEHRVLALQAQLRENQAGLELLLERLKYVEESAPFDAVVQKVHVQHGELVSSGRPLVELVSLVNLKAVISVPQKDGPGLMPGMPVSIEIPALDNISAASVIHSINPALEPGTRNMTATAFFPGNTGRIRPGMAVNAHVDLRKLHEAIMIPDQAVQRIGTQAWVYIVAGDQVHKRKIEPGPSRQGRVMVLKGLDEGELVVVTPDQRLKDQSFVSVIMKKDVK
jgi:membrane fusion protein, multidrug efflux system